MPIVPDFTLQVNATYCPTIHCNEKTGMADLAIQLFTNIEDAQSEANAIAFGSTDDSGIFTADVPSDQAVFVRAHHPDKGVYISQAHIASSTTSANIEINYKGHFIYDHSDELTLSQNHISWLYPTVGQISHYRYHFAQPVSTYDYLKLPDTYTNATVQVSIIDQLSENSFVIEESIDSLDYWLDDRYDNKHSNIWTFEENRILIVENNEIVDKVFSFILGENYYSAIHPLSGEEFEINLEDCVAIEIDLNQDDFYSIDWLDCLNVDNYELFNQSYEDLSIAFDSNAFLDGDDRIKVFSPTDGLVRKIGLNRMAHIVYGFDLVPAE